MHLTCCCAPQGTGDFQNPASGIGGYAERNVRFGVREHGMGAITNGLALHGVSLSSAPPMSSYPVFLSVPAALPCRQACWHTAAASGSRATMLSTRMFDLDAQLELLQPH